MNQIFSFNQYERDAWIRNQALLIPEGSKVLDVGAGTCPYRQFFAHCEYQAHDFSQLPQELNRSRKSYGVIDYVSDILAIPVQDASIDVIICTEVLEHVPEPIKVLSEFARMLRSGGKLLLTAPLGAGLHQEPYHFYGGYTPHFYTTFLPDAGFANITVEANGGFFKFYGQESRRFSYKLRAGKFNLFERLLIWPFWLATLPWFQLVMPVLGHFLDRYDRQQDFTVGYFVKAERR